MMSLHFSGLCNSGREQKQRWNLFRSDKPEETERFVFQNFKLQRYKSSEFKVQSSEFRTPERFIWAGELYTLLGLKPLSVFAAQFRVH
jgi:hypothetical protein